MECIKASNNRFQLTHLCGASCVAKYHKPRYGGRLTLGVMFMNHPYR